MIVLVSVMGVGLCAIFVAERLNGVYHLDEQLNQFFYRNWMRLDVCVRDRLILFGSIVLLLLAFFLAITFFVMVMNEPTFASDGSGLYVTPGSN